MRLRWLEVKLPLSLRAIGSKMKQRPFDRKTGEGYVLKRVRDSFIVGSFCERLEFTESIVDPLGNEQSVNRTIYRITDFSLFADSPFMELRNPPRTAQPFINSLLEIADFSLAVSVLKVNPMRWLAAFERHVSQQVIVNSMSLIGIDLGDGIGARVLVAGEKDVRNAVDSLLKKRRHVVDKVSATVRNGASELAKISLSSSAAAHLSETGAEKNSEALRMSLTAAT